MDFLFTERWRICNRLTMEKVCITKVFHNILINFFLCFSENYYILLYLLYLFATCYSYRLKYIEKNAEKY